MVTRWPYLSHQRRKKLVGVTFQHTNPPAQRMRSAKARVPGAPSRVHWCLFLALTTSEQSCVKSTASIFTGLPCCTTLKCQDSSHHRWTTSPHTDAEGYWSAKQGWSPPVIPLGHIQTSHLCRSCAGQENLSSIAGWENMSQMENWWNSLPRGSSHNGMSVQALPIHVEAELQCKNAILQLSLWCTWWRRRCGRKQAGHVT